MTKHRSRYIKFLFKMVLVFVSFAYVFYRFKNHTTDFRHYEFNFDLSRVFLLFLFVVLMPLNWLAESVKWKILVANFEKISLKRAVKSVLAGLVTGILTPNRVGEFGGRILFLKRRNRVSGVLVSGIGSLAQLLITFLFGIPGLILFFNFGCGEGNIILMKGLWVFASALIVLVIFFILFAKYDLIIRYLGQIRILGKYGAYFKEFHSFSFRKSLIVLSLSALRYVFFSTQFLLVLIFFIPDIDIGQALIGIMASYAVVTFVPGIMLSELGLRASAALYFIACSGDFDNEVIAATFFVWMLNIAIPTLIGTFFIYKAKI